MRGGLRRRGSDASGARGAYILERRGPLGRAPGLPATRGVPAHEQAHWERHIVDGRLRLGPPRYRQEVTSAGAGILVPTGEDGAYVKVVEGRYHVCPWRTSFVCSRHLVPRGRRVRGPGGVRERRERAPSDQGAQAAAAARAVAGGDDHAQSLARPGRWFVLFDDEERRLLEVGGRHRLSYLTTTRKALRRAEDAVPVLRQSDSDPSGICLEMHQWLAPSIRLDPRARLRRALRDVLGRDRRRPERRRHPRCPASARGRGVPPFGGSVPVGAGALGGAPSAPETN